jgi:hypothetical protein
LTYRLQRHGNLPRPLLDWLTTDSGQTVGAFCRYSTTPAGGESQGCKNFKQGSETTDSLTLGRSSSYLSILRAVWRISSSDVFFLNMRARKIKNIIIGLGVFIPCVISYYAGVFITSFDTNMCYSELIGNLSDQAQVVATSKDPAAMEEYAKIIKDLPIQGYESNCSDIRSYVQKTSIFMPAK